jgi:NADPH-dependent 2,4-dienoyl-CoA reductase/sulfur reductase-like enzyme
LKGEAVPGRKAVVLGGGFIGSEIAAALNVNQVDVTLVFPAAHLCAHVFPEDLGEAIDAYYAERGVKVVPKDKAAAIERVGTGFRVRTASGLALDADVVVAGIGIRPASDLADASGLKTSNGISVDGRLRTSAPDVYAAGDVASFPYAALGTETRVEHWDNALNQGLCAGRNMAGARDPYTHMPYFFSDLFEFGYEAVGEVTPKLETFADWRETHRTGVIYYLKEGRVRGAMLCNVWDKLDAARELIRKGEQHQPDGLRGAIR